MTKLSFFEHNRPSLQIWHASRLTFPKHLHKQIELGYILSGSTKLSINSTEYDVKEGEFFLIMPYQTHSFHDTEDASFHAINIIFDQTLVPTFKALLNQYYPLTPVFKAEHREALPIMRKIMALSEDQLKYKEHMISGYLSVLLALILEKCEFVTKKEDSELDMTQKILMYCSEHYLESLSLENIASALNISKSYVSQIFNNQLKISFKEYINQHRIREALALIDSGKTNLTEIAFDSGFQSLRSFNRNFSEYVGISPTDYKAQKTQPL